jgi:hypothetical protein
MGHEIHADDTETVACSPIIQKHVSQKAWLCKKKKRNLYLPEWGNETTTPLEFLESRPLSRPTSESMSTMLSKSPRGLNSVRSMTAVGDSTALPMDSVEQCPSALTGSGAA